MNTSQRTEIDLNSEALVMENGDFNSYPLGFALALVENGEAVRIEDEDCEVPMFEMLGDPKN